MLLYWLILEHKQGKERGHSSDCEKGLRAEENLCSQDSWKKRKSLWGLGETESPRCPAPLCLRWNQLLTTCLQNSECFCSGHLEFPYPPVSTGNQKPVIKVRRSIQFPRGSCCPPLPYPSHRHKNLCRFYKAVVNLGFIPCKRHGNQTVEAVETGSSDPPHRPVLGGCSCSKGMLEFWAQILPHLTLFWSYRNQGMICPRLYYWIRKEDWNPDLILCLAFLQPPHPHLADRRTEQLTTAL